MYSSGYLLIIKITLMRSKLFIFIGLVLFTNLMCKTDKESITILSWPGYEESDIVDLLKQKLDNKVNLKFISYTGGEDMLKKFENNKEVIDLIVADAEYGKILYGKSEIQLLDFESNSTISKNLGDYYP